MTDKISDLIERRFGLPTEAGRNMPASGTVAGMLSRSSQRRFRPEPVSGEMLEILLAAALSAPSKSDLQQASIVIVRDPARRAAVNGMVDSLPWVAQAPVFLVFCGDNLRIRRISDLRGKPFPNDTLDMFMNAAVDAGIVMQAFVTAAEAMGLGCCPISLVRNRVEALGELLELPVGVFPVAGLCVGHPAGVARLSMRLPTSVTVHTDRYDGGRFDADLAAYDARRAAREPVDAGKQRHVERYGVAAHYTWSEDKARQYSVPERHSFGPYVRAQGFALA